jgi:hypothetical protein
MERMLRVVLGRFRCEAVFERERIGEMISKKRGEFSLDRKNICATHLSRFFC